MSSLRRFAVIAVTLATLAAAVSPTPARAAQCRVVDFQFTPSADLQIVVWLEDKSGNFVDTIYMTQLTGRYGLGNRPGIEQFNTEWHWPYGRREGIFPIWAHKHGTKVDYPKIVFHNGSETRLSHPLSDSSREFFYCRPLSTTEGTTAVDSMTCPTLPSPGCAFCGTGTDKGVASTGRSLYPPRADLTMFEQTDSPESMQYKAMNDVDAVSRATPPAGLPFTLSFSVPTTLPAGDYVAFIEVSKEKDYNATYSTTAYPAPGGVDFTDLGEPYRGQPSVVWKAPITLDGTPHATVALDFAGFGDVDGLTGMLNPPDATITTGMEGTGAGRLLVASSADGMYRFRVASQGSDDAIPPGAPGAPTVSDITQTGAMLHFTAPGNDGNTGTAKQYEIRVLTGADLTEATFTQGTLIAASITPGAAGTAELIPIDSLKPQTHYSIGIRALDGCLNIGPVAIVGFDTPGVNNGNVSTCFVATAAWGSALEPEVAMLRAFRDHLLRHVALGEIFVETYYTFGPGLARLIGPSDTLRELARGALSPLVGLAHRTVGAR